MKYNCGLHISQLVLLLALCQAALYRGRLRGPNICYHYDIGRYCCEGFTQRNGLCLLDRKPSTTTTPAPLAGLSSRVRFAEKPKEIVSHTKLDERGRSAGNSISYLNARPEKLVYLLQNGVTRAVPENIEDYNVVVDMEKVHRQLSQHNNEATTPQAPVGEVTKQPKLRFQSSPKPFRPWDVKSDRLSVPYNQVAVGRAGDGYLQAVMTGQETQVNGQSGVEETNQRWLNEETDTAQVAAFRGPQIVTLPEDGKFVRTDPSSRPEDNEANRKYFKSVPVDTNSQEQGRAVIDTLSSKQCPDGYTPVVSDSEGNICYPTTALTQSIDKAPSRGDAAFVCPPGHQAQSSVYGEACVPYGWQPCSRGTDCSYSQELPLVKPLVVESECQTVSDESLPCKNFGPTQGGCSGNLCDGAQNIIAYGPENCRGSDCNSQVNDCLNGDCGKGPNSGCSTGDCFECEGGLCDSPYCFQRGIQQYDRNGRVYCICQQGFKGQRCEQREFNRQPYNNGYDVYNEYSSSITEEQDVDECSAPGTQGRGPCSHACLNTVGSFKCLCPAGSIVAPDGVSCMSITCPKCMHGGHCDTETNKCVCPVGFAGDICENDVNECEEVPGICSHECRNTFGSYACLCRQGYTLLKDGHSCMDWRCKPNCINGGVCIKNKCLCPSGFSGIICQFNNRL